MKIINCYDIINLIIFLLHKILNYFNKSENLKFEKNLKE